MLPPDKENSRLDELQKRLDSVTRPLPRKVIKPLSPIKSDTQNKWEGSTEDQSWRDEINRVHEDVVPRKKIGLLGWVLIVSAIFFVGASIFAFWSFSRSSNTATAGDVNIEVVGPVSVGGGQTLSLDIAISNNNQGDIRLVDLIIEYPEGTKSPLGTPLTRTRESVGDLTAGSLVKKNIQAVLYGPEKSKQSIIARTEYRVEGSNAIFEKEKIFEVEIGTAPVTVVLSGQTEALPNQSFDTVVSISSNTQTPLSDVVLKASYPPGFRFISSDQKTEYDNSTWNIGELLPLEKKTITIKGVIEGVDTQTKAIRFETVVGKALVSSNIQTIEIKKPFLAVDLKIDGSDEQSIAVPGKSIIQSQLIVTNNTDAPLYDVSAEIKMDGTTLDRSSVRVTRGFYKSAEGVIVYDRNSSDSLKQLDSGKTETFTFSFSSLPLASKLERFVNPAITFNVSASGKRVGENNVPETITDGIKKIARFKSDVTAVANTLHFTGPFENMGPIPPKVEQQTTYTIQWILTSSSNDLNDVIVKGQLPLYVEWTNVYSTGERISYDPVSRTVKWDAGNVSAGSGYDKPPRVGSFQVSLVPSATQSNTSFPLFYNQTMEWFDSFAGSQGSLDIDDAETTLKDNISLPASHDVVE